MATYARRGWVAPNGHLTLRSLPSLKFLECRIRNYREGARRDLLKVIRELETGLYHQAGGFFPVAARLTSRQGRRGHTRAISLDGRPALEQLRQEFPCTRPKDFLLKYYEGGRVRSKFSIWTHNPCAAEIGELQQALGCHEGACKTGTGELSVYEAYVEALGTLRAMRREAYRMVSWGASKSFHEPTCPEEAELDALLLPGSLREAAKRVKAALTSILTATIDNEELAAYWEAVADGQDGTSFAELLDTDTRALLSFTKLPDKLWQHVVRRQLGLRTNEVVPEPAVRLAEIIQLGPRSTGQRDENPPIYLEAIGAF